MCAAEAQLKNELAVKLWHIQKVTFSSQFFLGLPQFQNKQHFELLAAEQGEV